MNSRRRIGKSFACMSACLGPKEEESHKYLVKLEYLFIVVYCRKLQDESGRRRRRLLLSFEGSPGRRSLSQWATGLLVSTIINLKEAYCARIGAVQTGAFKRLAQMRPSQAFSPTRSPLSSVRFSRKKLISRAHSIAHSSTSGKTLLPVPLRSLSRLSVLK